MNELYMTRRCIISICSLGLAGQEVEDKTGRGRIKVPLQTELPADPNLISNTQVSPAETREAPSHAQTKLLNCRLESYINGCHFFFFFGCVGS